MGDHHAFSALRKLRSDEKGSATIEFVLWLPLLTSLFLIATDATVAFMRHSQMWQVSRDTARIVSRYGMTESAAESYARQNASFGTTVPGVTVIASGTQVAVAIETPASALTVFGTLDFALGSSFRTHVIHAMEPS